MPHANVIDVTWDGNTVVLTSNIITECVFLPRNPGNLQYDYKLMDIMIYPQDKV